MTDEKDSKPAPPASPAPPAAAPPPPAGAAAGAPPGPPPAPKVDPFKAPVASPAVELLRKRFPDQVMEVDYHVGEPLVRLRKERFVEIATYLRDDPALRFDYLSNLSGVHWPKRPLPLEVVYHLFSISRRHRVTLKIDLADGEETPTACGVWATANWHEREVFDLLGIRFTGHPDMTRILMTDEWIGHPLRKDYPLEGKPEDHLQYRDVATAEHVYRYEKAPIRGFGWKKEVDKTGVGNG